MAAKRSGKAAQRKRLDGESVFINCPFDPSYSSLFDALVFTVMYCGFRARCALETDDATETRIAKISRIVGECRLSVHDLSRTELDPVNELPRFNMPLELGLFLGAKAYGGKRHSQKIALIFDVERYRYQKFISDLAGHDISAHHGSVEQLVLGTRNWLATLNDGRPLPGASAITDDYQQYLTDLPIICARSRLEPTKLTSGDRATLIYQWLEINEQTR